MLDTNVFIYAAGKPSPYKESCVVVLQRVESRQLRAVIDTEVIQELLYRYWRLGLIREATEVATYALRIGASVLPVTRTDMEEATALLERYGGEGVSPRDTVHAAVMRNRGLREIVSLDEHFDRIEELVRVAPEQLLRRER